MLKKLFLSLVLVTCIVSLPELSFTQSKRKSPRKPAVPPKSVVIETPVRNLSPEQKRRLESFQIVWQTLYDNYFDRTFNGLNWQAIKREYEPKVLNSQTDGEFYRLLDEMVNRLNRSHFAIIPPEIFQTLEKARKESKIREKKRALNLDSDPENFNDEENDEDVDDETETLSKYGIGIEIRLINDQFVITRVEKDSAAEKNGLKTGYVIEKINHISLNELLRKVVSSESSKKKEKKFLPIQIVNYFLNGEADTFVKIGFLDETDQSKEIEIKREKLKGELIKIARNFPENFFIYEAKDLNEKTGYIRFNYFALPVIENFCHSLSEFKEKQAIIIDLRGNLGGLIGISMGLGGMLSDKTIDLGTQIYKIGQESLVAQPKVKNFKGKLVFLVDNFSVSAAEMFAAAMKENNRAVVVGEKTAGEALPAFSLKLPTGAVFIYPIANFKTRNGNLLEGIGVEPNFMISLDRKSLLDGKDVQLEAALKIIEEEIFFPNISKPQKKVGGSLLPPPQPLPKPQSSKSSNNKLKVLENVTNRAPEEKTEVENNIVERDAKSIEIIDEFIKIIGGAAELKNINSYHIKGTTKLSFRGANIESDISIYRQKPDKYSEIMESEDFGGVREVYNGQNMFIQADFGLTSDFPFVPNPENLGILSPITLLLEKNNFKKLKYQGIFDRSGRKIHLLEATDKENLSFSLVFDVEKKVLVSFANMYMVVVFEDYQKVENLLLPFYINREKLMEVFIEEINLNPQIDEKFFHKKINCYDIPE